MRVSAVVLGVAVAAVCVRLGVWQLDRRAERRAWNAQVETRLAAPPLLLASGVITTTTDSLAYRRARAAGAFVFADQTIERNRSLRGAPGVFVLTPLRLADGTGILVNRGWAFAPDAQTVDLARLAEPESTLVEGVLLPPVGRFAVRPESLAVRYPLFPLVLRRTDAPPGVPGGLTAVALPPRDDGPHLSYAFQWFAFATIAAVGGVILARRRDATRKPGPRESPRVPHGLRGGAP